MNIKLLRFGILFAIIGIIFYVFIPNTESCKKFSIKKSRFPKGRSGGGGVGGGSRFNAGQVAQLGGWAKLLVIGQLIILFNWH